MESHAEVYGLPPKSGGDEKYAILTFWRSWSKRELCTANTDTGKEYACWWPQDRKMACKFYLRRYKTISNRVTLLNEHCFDVRCGREERKRNRKHTVFFFIRQNH